MLFYDALHPKQGRLLALDATTEATLYASFHTLGNAE